MSDDKKDDATRIGGAPPAAPKLPTAAPPSVPKSPGGDPATGPVGDSTHLGGAPPQLPKPGASAPPAPPVRKPAGAPPGPPAESEADEGEETVAIAPVARRTPYSLQRVQPAGHTGIIYLTGDTYLMGRKQGADLPLFSPTASREHARLERRSDGWYLAAVEGKTVIANGSTVRAALRLEHKMRLQIGGDELIFFDAMPAVRSSPSVGGTAARTDGSRRWVWVLVALGLAAVGIALAWLLRATAA